MDGGLEENRLVILCVKGQSVTCVVSVTGLTGLPLNIQCLCVMFFFFFIRDLHSYKKIIKKTITRTRTLNARTIITNKKVIVIINKSKILRK